MKASKKPIYEIGPIETGIPIPLRYTGRRQQDAARERVLSLPVGGSFTLAVGASPPRPCDVAIRLVVWARGRSLVLRYRRIDEFSVRIWRCEPSETVEGRTP